MKITKQRLKQIVQEELQQMTPDQVYQIADKYDWDVEEDNQGMIVIYTGVYATEDGEPAL